MITSIPSTANSNKRIDSMTIFLQEVSKKTKMIKRKVEIDSNGKKLYVAIDRYFPAKMYYKDKEYKIFHREDGPAIESENGDKEWYVNGLRHRVGGPAIEETNGHKEWWMNGKRHREDGPAVIYSTGGNEYYYLNGVQYEEEEYWGMVRLGSFV